MVKGGKWTDYEGTSNWELGTWNWELSLTKIWALNESQKTLNEYTNNG